MTDPGPGPGPATGPHLYDVLDVDPTASTEEIRAAWRTAIADLTPADRRFRLYNEAAEVLLDDQRRAAYDATLPAAETEPESAPEGPVAPTTEPTAEPTTESTAEPVTRTRPLVPTWLLIGLAVLTALAVGLAGYLFTQPSQGSVDEATASARAAAERAIVPVLSYDYRDLEGSREAATEVITPDFEAEEYDRFFTGVVVPNAESTETVVEAELVASSVVRSGEDRVELLLFVNRPTTNARDKEPVVYRDQVRVVMELVGDEWLVDCLITTPDGTC